MTAEAEAATSTRIASRALAAKVRGAEEAAALIEHDANVGMSGFTGSGYPKAVPGALAERIASRVASNVPSYRLSDVHWFARRILVAVRSLSRPSWPTPPAERP